MTFYEAAIEVLRRTGRPLHFKKITEVAIRQELLSHVGKSPEVTMGARLDQEVKKEDDGWVLRTRPGVFTLREDILDRLNAEAAEIEEVEEVEEPEAEEEVRETRGRGRGRGRGRRDEETKEESVEESVEEDEDEKPRSRSRKRNDDDAPRRGRSRNRDEDEGEKPRARGRGRKSEDEDEKPRGRGQRDEDEDEKPRARGRKSEDEDEKPRSRGRGRKSEDEDEKPRASRSRRNREDSEEEEKPRARRGRGRGPARDEDEKPRSRARGNQREEEEEDERPGRRRRRRRSEEDEAPAAKPKKEARKSEEKRGRRKQNDGEVSGRYDSVQDAAEAVLQAAGKPMNAEAIAETIFAKKLVKLHTHDRAATVDTALLTANQLNDRPGRRTTFTSYSSGVWGLTEWGLGDANNEKKLGGLMRTFRDDAWRRIGDELSKIRPENLEMVIAGLLEQTGYRNLKVSKRTSEGDVFFTADWRRGFSESRVCVQLVFETDIEIGADDVADLRDTMSHYSATEGVLIHLGKSARDAIREARKEGEANVAVLDRERLARMFADEGVGIRKFTLTVPVVDLTFFEALKA